MTPDDMARLHQAAFTSPAPWRAQSFAALLAEASVFALASPCGRAFVLGRALAGEADLLTLATHPDARRCGLARALLALFEAEARARGAETAFLEVAENNTAARALYAQAGWQEAGRRPGYYRAGTNDPKGRAPVAALILHKKLAG
ncbi:MAG: GNAT family N-acetyltransferase [Pararhodobacter sp.]|nr:GNAT family N-acetyltransferase [Pararhodobacter sp.]